MRTTIDIDDLVLHELKRLQQREREPLGRLMSDLLAQSLALRRAPAPPTPAFRWTSRAIGARVDLRDKDAVRDALDGPSSQ